jgi:hypothetical protein
MVDSRSKVSFYGNLSQYGRRFVLLRDMVPCTVPLMLLSRRQANLSDIFYHYPHFGHRINGSSSQSHTTAGR